MTGWDRAARGSDPDALRLNPRFLALPEAAATGFEAGSTSPPAAPTLATLALDGLTPPEMTFLRRAVHRPLSCWTAGADSIRMQGSLEQLGDLASEWSEQAAPAAGLGRALQTTVRGVLARHDRVAVAHGRELDLTPGAAIMGVLNITPDSFSDGGRFLDPDRAVEHALTMARAGAALLDIGGESTRPGAGTVSADEELERVLPVIERLGDRTDALLSIDTSRAATARAAVRAGAHLVNDVTALEGDPDMGSVVAETGAGVVLMHMQGTPRTMQQAPAYRDVVSEVIQSLRRALLRAESHGVPPERTLVDPGIGFGKTVEHNLELLKNLDALRSLGRPRVLGVSRKSFLGRITNEPDPLRRGPASIGVAALAAARGLEVIRVHDVPETVQAVRAVEAVIRGRAGGLDPAGEVA